MRVFVSDLLYPIPPEDILVPLRARQGRPVVFALFDPVDEDPPWDGTVVLIDCESQQPRRAQITAELRAHYRDAYQRHIESWIRLARRYDVILARVSSAATLQEALQSEALYVGAVEPCSA